MLTLQTISDKLFPDNYELIDGADEIFELNFALWEFENLTKQELLTRSAYFKFIDGKGTVHYQACNLQNLEDIHRNSSLRTKAFFLNGKYSTGYATHSLFPYKGKFHPQMIRTLLNMIGLKPGSVVLDPMSGSGTLSVEANLLGIDSVGVDISPFCCLMGRVKTFSLNLDSKKLGEVNKAQSRIFEKLNKSKVPNYFLEDDSNGEKSYYEIALLAFLDAMGYARRSSKSIYSLFPTVFNRYVTTVNNFQLVRERLKLHIGKSIILRGSAIRLPIEDNSIDGVITSPPYSFAIDYIENDKPQLEYLGYNSIELKKEMIGLEGKTIDEKLQIYFDMISKVFKELSRVTKKGTKTVFVVGTNDIQTKGRMLESEIKRLAKIQGFKYLLEILKPIKGLQNTMMSEYILFFENNK